MTRTIIAIVVAVLVCGCGDDDGMGAPTLDAGGGGTDAGRDAGASREPVTLRVIDLFEPDTGVAGATVALDAPGEVRVEQVTGADGTVTFEIDVTQPFDVTYHAPDHNIVSLLGVDATNPLQLHDSMDRILLPISIVQPETATITGMALGMTSPGNSLTVAESVYGYFHQDVGPMISMPAPLNTPFTLIGTEWAPGPAPRIQTFYAWTAASHDAITADTSIDIDFTMSLAPTTTTGSFVVPATMSTFNPYALVRVVGPRGPAGFAGFATSMIPTTDGSGRVDFEIEHVDVPGFAAVRTFLQLQSPPEFSVVSVDGVPSGAVTADFLVPPDIDSPAFGESVGPGGTVIITNVETDIAPAFYVYRRTEQRDEAFWFGLAAPGATQMHIPAPPSTIDAAYWGTGDVNVTVQLCERLAPDSIADPSCVRFATSRAAEFRPMP